MQKYKCMQKFTHLEVTVKKSYATLWTHFHQVTATDADRGYNGQVTYSMEPANTPFEIDSSSGMITVSRFRNLDRETNPFYLITVIARDNSLTIPQLDGFCDFTISVTDVNDEEPQFQLAANDYKSKY